MVPIKNMFEVGGTLRLKNMLEVGGRRNAALEEKADYRSPQSFNLSVG